jgi:hypothetical protein
MKKKIISPVNGGFELNKSYHSRYWNQSFTVIAIHEPHTVIPWSNWAVTVQWEDGNCTTHCTTRDKRDRELINVT